MQKNDKKVSRQEQQFSIFGMVSISSPCVSCLSSGTSYQFLLKPARYVQIIICTFPWKGIYVHLIDLYFFSSSSGFQAIILNHLFRGFKYSIKSAILELNWLLFHQLIGSFRYLCTKYGVYLAVFCVLMQSIYIDRDLIRLLSKRTGMIVCQLISYSCTE